MALGRTAGDLTNGTGLGGGTGGVHPLVTGSLAVGGTTGGAGLGLRAGAFGPGVTVGFTVGSTAGGAGHGSITVSHRPLVALGRTAGDLTNGTGLGSGAGGVQPLVAGNLTFGQAAAGAGLGSLAGSIRPGMDVSLDNRGGGSVGITQNANQIASGGALHGTGHHGEGQIGADLGSVLELEGNGDHQIAVVDQARIGLAGLGVGVLHQVHEAALIDAVGGIVLTGLLIAGGLNLSGADLEGIHRLDGHQLIHGRATFGDHGGQLALIKVQIELQSIQLGLNVLDGDDHIELAADCYSCRNLDVHGERITAGACNVRAGSIAVVAAGAAAVGLGSKLGGSIGTGNTEHFVTGGAQNIGGREGQHIAGLDGRQSLELNGDHQIAIVDQTLVGLTGLGIGIGQQINETALVVTAGGIIDTGLLITGSRNLHTADLEGICRLGGHESIHFGAAFGDHTGNLGRIELQQKFHSVQFFHDVLNGDGHIDDAVILCVDRSGHAQGEIVAAGRSIRLGHGGLNAAGQGAGADGFRLGNGCILRLGSRGSHRISSTGALTGSGSGALGGLNIHNGIHCRCGFINCVLNGLSRNRKLVNRGGGHFRGCVSSGTLDLHSGGSGGNAGSDQHRHHHQKGKRSFCRAILHGIHPFWYEMRERANSKSSSEA